MAITHRLLSTRLHEGGAYVGEAYVSGLSMTVYQCGSCGVEHGLTKAFTDARRSDHKTFYCPWCQTSLVFNGESDEERFRRERDEAQRRLQATRDLLTHEERSHAATKGHLTRTKKRIKNGVCPCCNRHFSNVEAHMASQHPDFNKGQEAAEKG